jgi:hypothetical protein
VSGLTSIIHPGLTENLAAQGFFPDTGSVQSFTVAMVEGDAVETWSDVAGLVDLDCAVAALTAREIAALDMDVAESTHKASLTAEYTTITRSMRFVTGGVTYEITGVKHDQQGTLTYLLLKKVSI